LAIVTFTTDFGSLDGYAGAMKGVVLSLAPATTLVDITHAIPPQDVKAGAVALAQAAPLFPRGTIHVAVVDPGVGGARADLVVEAADGDLFIGPDNGLLSLAARAPRRAYRIEEASFTRQPVSPTFHGRDVFAPTAGRLAAGARAADVGPPAGAIVELDLPLQRWLGDRVDGAVIHVDTYGNLVTSVTADAVPPGADIEVVVEGTEGTFHPRMGRTFGDVEPGALVAYVGSMGRLEIAVRDGSAAARIGAARGSVVRLRGCGPEGGVA
jgi:S-adenosylmethionine hydrolase